MDSVGFKIPHYSYHNRCAALGDGIIRKELSKLAKYVCFDNF
jgi:hypothetical protein